MLSNVNQNFKALVSTVFNPFPKTFTTRVERTIPAVEIVNIKRKYKYLTDKNNNNYDQNVFFKMKISFLITLFNNRRKFWLKPLPVQRNKQ